MQEEPVEDLHRLTLEEIDKRVESLDQKVSFAIELLRHISSNLDHLSRYGNNKR